MSMTMLRVLLRAQQILISAASRAIESYQTRGHLCLEDSGCKAAKLAKRLVTCCACTRKCEEFKSLRSILSQRECGGVGTCRPLTALIADGSILIG